MCVAILIFMVFSWKNSSVFAGNVAYSARHAVMYAERYWGKTQYAHEDSKYFQRYPNNCNNFINQALLAGFTKTTYMKDVKSHVGRYTDKQGKFTWYYRDFYNRARAWSVVQDMYEYAKHNTSGKGIHFTFIGRDYPKKFMDVTTIKPGDVVFMDWENDGHMDHSMIVTKILRGKYYNDIRVTGHNDHYRNRSFLTIKRNRQYDPVFYVYRPYEFEL